MTYGIVYKTTENSKITREQVKECVSAIKKIIQENKDIVRIEFKDKSCCNEYNINFNGIGKKGYETFIFYSKFKVNPAEEIVDALEDKENNDFPDVISTSGKLKICRVATLKKEYDKVVKQALMKCQEITNDAFEIYCDDYLRYHKDKITHVKKENKEEFKSLEQVGKKYKYDWSVGGKSHAKLGK